MKHIKDSDDWFYEFRPYIIIGFGVAGLLARLFMSAPIDWSFLNFLCCAVNIAAGLHIIEMRKDYRKTALWMK